MVRSRLALAKVLPSGLKAMDVTVLACPASVRISSPVAKFQSLMVRSRLALARVLPSGLKATDVTVLSIPPKCTDWLVLCLRFQILIVLSKLPLARVHHPD